MCGVSRVGKLVWMSEDGMVRCGDGMEMMEGVTNGM